MADREVIYIMSDNLIEVGVGTEGVKNVATNSFINDADVTLTLVDAATGTEVAGQTWPVTLSYVTGSDGIYRGTINNEATLTHQQALIAKITVDGGAGLTRYWEKPCVAMVGS